MSLYGLYGGVKTETKEWYGLNGGTKSALKEIYGLNSGVKDLIFSAKGIDLNEVDAVKFYFGNVSVRKIGSSTFTDLNISLPDTYTYYNYLFPSFVPNRLYAMSSKAGSKCVKYYTDNTGELVSESMSYNYNYNTYYGFKCIYCDGHYFEWLTDKTGVPTEGGWIHDVYDNYIGSGMYPICNNIFWVSGSLKKISVSEDDEYTDMNDNTWSPVAYTTDIFESIRNTYSYYYNGTSRINFASSSNRSITGNTSPVYTVYNGCIYYAVMWCHSDVSIRWSDGDGNEQEYTDSGFCINVYKYNLSTNTATFLGSTNTNLSDSDWYSYSYSDGETTSSNGHYVWFQNFSISVSGSYVYVKTDVDEYDYEDDTESDHVAHNHIFRISTSSSNSTMSTYTSFPTNSGGYMVSSRNELITLATSYNFTLYLPATNYTG